MRFTVIVAAALAAASAMPAHAAVLEFTGSGTIDDVVGRLPTTGIAPIGGSTTIRFNLDTAASTLYESGVDYAVYDLSVTGVAATIGGYTFTPNSDPLFTPALTIDKGFSFFGGISSEASYAVGFYLSDVPRSAVEENPFDVATGSRGTLSIQALFKADEIGDWDLSLGLLPDLSRAASQSSRMSIGTPRRVDRGSCAAASRGRSARMSLPCPSRRHGVSCFSASGSSAPLYAGRRAAPARFRNFADPCHSDTMPEGENGRNREGWSAQVTTGSGRCDPLPSRAEDPQPVIQKPLPASELRPLVHLAARAF
jgi:hypothetical protein